MRTGFVCLLVCFCLCGKPSRALAGQEPEGSVVSLHFSPYGGVIATTLDTIGGLAVTVAIAKNMQMKRQSR